MNETVQHYTDDEIVALKHDEHMEAHSVTRNNYRESLDAIGTALAEAKQYGLEAEVMLFAMYALKKNPEITIADAMECGVSEWIK